MIEIASLKVGFFLAMVILCVFDMIRNYEKDSFWQRIFAQIGIIILIYQAWFFFLNLAEYIKLI